MPATYSFERIEKKFLLTRTQEETLVRRLEAFTTPEVFGLHSVCNIYYDTPDLALVRHSIERPVYKEKFRVRSYGVPGENDIAFAEIKKKADGIVYKRRVSAEMMRLDRFLTGEDLPDQDGQIQREIRWFMKTWSPEPKVFIGYDRFAMLGKDDPELRITFDHRLRFRREDLDLRAGDHGTLILPDDPVIMEIKLPMAAPLWLAHLLSEQRIWQTSFSKYGACYIHHMLPELIAERKMKTC